MADIEVACRPAGDGWRCQVEIREGDTATSHDVAVTPGDLARLDPGASDPQDLVRRSFAFLLEREPKESILRAFELTVIGRYFPDWERTVRR
jgi:hypothetical protein